MQIGMASSVPTTDEQKAEMKKLAHLLLLASDQARRVAESFGRVVGSITVEGRDMEALLACLNEQVTEVVERA